MEYTRQAKRDFAAIGRAWFFYFAVSLAVVISGEFLAGIFGGTWLESDWGLYMVGLVIPYLFAFPVFFLLIRRKAAPGTFSPEKRKLPFRSLLKWFCIAQFLMFLETCWAVLEYSYRDAYWCRDNHNDRFWSVLVICFPSLPWWYCLLQL